MSCGPGKEEFVESTVMEVRNQDYQEIDHNY